MMRSGLTTTVMAQVIPDARNLVEANELASLAHAKRYGIGMRQSPMGDARAAAEQAVQEHAESHNLAKYEYVYVATWRGRQTSPTVLSVALNWGIRPAASEAAE